jgi:hypothetical protein
MSMASSAAIAARSGGEQRRPKPRTDGTDGWMDGWTEGVGWLYILC